MASDAVPVDLERIRTEQGFDAYIKAVARHQGESAARAAMAQRAPAEREAAVAQNRRDLEQWRSTPEGEADYRQTCDRVLRTVGDIEADGPVRAAG